MAMGVPGIAVLALDGYGLGKMSLWLDEAYTVDAAHRSLPEIFALLRHTDAVNCTYYVLMHGDIAAFGTSEVALRLPSLLAAAIAAVVVAVIGRRLARAMALPAPDLTGLTAGMLFGVAPQVTRYAQEARGYAIVTLTAVVATYLLLRGLADGRWRWWAGYGAAVAATGLLNLFALLLVLAHGVTMLILRIRQQAGGAPPPGQPPPVRLSRWLVPAGTAGLALVPLALLGYQQRHQISWLHRPGLGQVVSLAASFAGAGRLLPLIAALALAAVVASVAGGRRRALDVAVVTLPWLVLPAAVLLLASQAHPVYDQRYVAYCLPALALLVAAGLAALARACGRTPLARVDLAWLPAAVAVAAIAVLLVAPQRSVRRPSSRPDNLRREAAILAAHEQPGDAVLYLRFHDRVDSIAYPGPFRRLWDVALDRSPVAAGNLRGTDVAPRVLRRRFARVRRVWVISGTSVRLYRSPRSRIDKAEVALLARFRLAGQWHARRRMLRLYVRG